MPRNFWDRVDKTGECWLWTGARARKDYGAVRFQGRQQPAHRVAWQLTFGPIPGGLFVLHHCDNPPCVRPDHLFLGTQADNMADKVAKGRQARLGRRKLAPIDVVAIRWLGSRLPQRTVARMYQIDQSQVSRIATGKRWNSAA